MNVRLATLAVALVSTLASLPASALVARAFVSGSGSDANTAVNCSLTQPCRTFQTAMTVLNDGGEVIALDSAGYGTVNITKSVSLIAPAGIFAGLTPTSGNGVTIATAGVKVNLRGITINSLGGTAGIFMTNGAQLNLEGVAISGFTGSGHGALIVNTPAVVTVNNTTIANVGGGMNFGNGATATVTNSRLQGIEWGGIGIFGGTGPVTVSVSDTSVTGIGNTGSACIANWASAGSVGRLFLTRVTATNCDDGIVHMPVSEDAGNVILVGNSMVTGNTVGLHNNVGPTFGYFSTLGNNQVAGNTSDTNGTITAVGTH